MRVPRESGRTSIVATRPAWIRTPSGRVRYASAPKPTAGTSQANDPSRRNRAEAQSPHAQNNRNVVSLKTFTVCPNCKQPFCELCDVFLHEQLSNCIGCLAK